MLAAVLWLLVLMLVPGGYGYSTGAPDKVCDSMKPGHRNTNEQEGGSPHRISLDRYRVSQGETVAVTISSIYQPSVSFRGFLIKALGMKNYEETVVGSFREEGTYKILTCGGVTNSAATQTDKSDKKELRLTWVAPSDYEGEVTFVARTLTNYTTYYKLIRSDKPLQVVRSEFKYSSPPVRSSTAPSSARSSTSSPLQSNPIYEGCFTTKGCFGPGTCVRDKTCEYMVTYRVQDDTPEFELMTTRSGNTYVAVGFSEDNKMGDDSVIQCVNRGDRPAVWVSKNVDKSNQQVTKIGVTETNLESNGGVAVCKFTRNKQAEQFNLLDDRYYLMMAVGSAGASGGEINPHDLTTGMIVSGSKTSIRDVSGLEASSSSRALLAAHGCLMIIAWVGTVSIAIFIARYYKPVWPNSTIIGQKIWFQLHRGLNTLCIVCTSVGFILVFVYREGISQQWNSNPHPILGICVTALTFGQLLMAVLRPHPGTKYRPLFNWAHFILGNITLIAAHITMYFAKTMNSVNLPYCFYWVLVCYDSFHVIMFLVMELYEQPEHSEQPDRYEGI